MLQKNMTKKVGREPHLKEVRFNYDHAIPARKDRERLQPRKLPEGRRMPPDERWLVGESHPGPIVRHPDIVKLEVRAIIAHGILRKNREAQLRSVFVFGAGVILRGRRTYLLSIIRGAHEIGRVLQALSHELLGSRRAEEHVVEVGHVIKRGRAE